MDKNIIEPEDDDIFFVEIKSRTVTDLYFLKINLLLLIYEQQVNKASKESYLSSWYLECFVLEW